MSTNNNFQPFRREYYPISESNVIDIPVAAIYSPSKQRDTLLPRETSNIKKNPPINLGNDLLDSDPLTSEEIIDLEESYDDYISGRSVVISGETETRNIIKKILEFRSDE
jgi:hypothetical protein